MATAGLLSCAISRDLRESGLIAKLAHDRRYLFHHTTLRCAPKTGQHAIARACTFWRARLDFGLREPAGG